MHVYKCSLKSKCFTEPFFEINITMKLKKRNQLETYENYFHKKGFFIPEVAMLPTSSGELPNKFVGRNDSFSFAN